jgi:hypothetical protein
VKMCGMHVAQIGGEDCNVALIMLCYMAVSRHVLCRARSGAGHVTTLGFLSSTLYYHIRVLYCSEVD